MGHSQNKIVSSDRVFDSAVKEAVEDFIARIAVEAMAGQVDFAEGLAALAEEVAAQRARIEWLDGVLNPPRAPVPGLEGKPLRPEDRVMAVLSQHAKKVQERKERDEK
jgi:hypothetical protein